MKRHLHRIRKSRLHKFHIRYRWLAVVAAVSGSILIWKGIHEIGTVSLGLAFEAALHHAFEFAAEEA